MFKQTLLILVLANVMITSEVHYHYHYSSPSTQKHNSSLSTKKHMQIGCNNQWDCPPGMFCYKSIPTSGRGTCMG